MAPTARPLKPSRPAPPPFPYHRRCARPAVHRAHPASSPRVPYFRHARLIFAPRALVSPSCARPRVRPALCPCALCFPLVAPALPHVAALLVAALPLASASSPPAVLSPSSIRPPLLPPLPHPPPFHSPLRLKHRLTSSSSYFLSFSTTLPHHPPLLPPPPPPLFSPFIPLPIALSPPPLFSRLLLQLLVASLAS
ncbi:unnamed protein product [Closterium sp. NIES-64]|nr:unnamed protein product [Closterium sp. NIES-64]CAI5972469.1 unnamed protein product [Closterium sp. NIES-64]